MLANQPLAPTRDLQGNTPARKTETLDSKNPKTCFGPIFHVQRKIIFKGFLLAKKKR